MTDEKQTQIWWPEDEPAMIKKHSPQPYSQRIQNMTFEAPKAPKHLFYLDVGNVSPEKVPEIVNKFNEDLKKKKEQKSIQMEDMHPNETFIDEYAEMPSSESLEKSYVKKERESEMQELRKDLEAYGILIDTFKKMDAIFTEGKQQAALAVGMDLPVSIKEWCASAHAVSRSKGWYDDETGDNFPTKLVLVHSELSEVLEEYRNGKGMNEIYYSDKGKPEGIPVEMADVFIRLFDMCEYFGIDVDSAIKIKHEYNKTRPHRHGGKKI